MVLFGIRNKIPDMKRIQFGHYKFI